MFSHFRFCAYCVSLETGLNGIDDYQKQEIPMTTYALQVSHVQIPLGLVSLIGRWLTRRRMREELLALDDEQLTDVGLSRDMVLAAANKPFYSI